MTVVTTVVFGLMYPMIVTGLAKVIFPHKANGQLIVKDGTVIGSSIIGQGFAGPQYFHSRPSAAGDGYDAGNSAGSTPWPNQSEASRSRKGGRDRSTQGKSWCASSYRHGDNLGLRV
jgi:K+-transporting ATPase ATPase C chain